MVNRLEISALYGLVDVRGLPVGGFESGTSLAVTFAQLAFSSRFFNWTCLFSLKESPLAGFILKSLSKISSGLAQYFTFWLN